jgi:hypothetical protein
MKASVCDLPTIDIISLRKDQQSTGYGRAGDGMTHLQGRIDRFTSGEWQISFVPRSPVNEIATHP